MYELIKTGWGRLKADFKSSSGGEELQMSTCLSKISCCNSNYKVADIVFVHGLGGNDLDTWTNSGGFCWPKELGKELSNVDIWTLGYNASPIGQVLALPHLAANVVAHLENAVGSCPVIFICHSLGGLLVKQILRNCSDRQDEGRNIFVNSKGVVFLATPHAGSQLAAKLKKIPLVKGSLLFRALDWNDPHLNDLNLWFRDNFKGEVAVYCETMPTSGIIVVDLNSSDPGMPQVRPVPIEADHIAICKPANTSELVYVDVKRFIERVLFNETSLSAESILHSICKFSLFAYQKELFLLNSTKWISRSISEQIQFSTCDRRKSIQFLVGESGFGKSTLAFQELKEHIDAGGYGLWLPASVVYESYTLQNAIAKVITSLYPSVDIDIINSLFKNISPENKLHIVVDDINQEKDSIKIAHKLISWATLVGGEKKEVSTSIITCPIWPKLWSQLEIVTKGQEWIDTIFIEAFDNSEGTEALLLSDSTLSRIEAETLASKLGNDPILIALFSLMRKDIPDMSSDLLVEDVIEKYINNCIFKVVSLEQSFLANEYQQVLVDLSTVMIQKKSIHPTWSEIKAWFVQNGKSVDMIRSLIRTEFICRLNSQNKFVFRHDRILNTLLIKALVQLFKMKNNIDYDILAEPFYSELIAKAILKKPDVEMVKQLKKTNILALVEALKIFGTAKNDFERTIIVAIIDWVKKHKSISSSLLHFICLSLVESDSSSVFDITQELPSNPLVWLARLRNGCAVSGVKYCQLGFALSIGDQLRDKIVEHAKQRYQDELIGQLKLLFNKTDASDAVRAGVLSFAGFVASDALLEYVLPYWRSAVDKRSLLPAAIWAGLRCSGSNPEIVLDELLTFWAMIPEKDDNNDHSPRSEVAEELRFSLLYGVEKKTLEYLCEQQRQVDNLKWPIAFMLELVDSPTTMEMIVNTAGDIQRKVEKTKGFSPWIVTLTDNWNGQRGDGRRLSDQSLAYLYKTWTTTTDKHIQWIAFRLWTTRIDNEDIDILRDVSSDSAIYNLAVRKRAQLGDLSVTSEFVMLLKEDYHWCNVAHHIWSPEIMAVVRQYISGFEANIPKDFSGGLLNPHYDVSVLITKIPLQDAELLIVDYWDILGYSPRFVQAALYLSTQKSLKLAAKSIKKCPADVDLFRNIGSLFGFLSERRIYLTETKLNSLIPYLKQLSEFDLREILEACERLGIPEWGKKHIVNMGEKNRKRYNPSDIDLMMDLDEMVNNQHGILRIDYWLEYFNKRNDSHERALQIIDRWLEKSKRDNKSYEIAAAVLKKIGSRKHINILEKHQPLNISSTMLSEIIEDTKFAIFKRTLD